MVYLFHNFQILILVPFLLLYPYFHISNECNIYLKFNILSCQCPKLRVHPAPEVLDFTVG